MSISVLVIVSPIDVVGLEFPKPTLLVLSDLIKSVDDAQKYIASARYFDLVERYLTNTYDTVCEGKIPNGWVVTKRYEEEGTRFNRYHVRLLLNLHVPDLPPPTWHYFHQTDMFGGELNYGWVTKFAIRASNKEKAFKAFKKHCGGMGKQLWEDTYQNGTVATVYEGDNPFELTYDEESYTRIWS